MKVESMELKYDDSKAIEYLEQLLKEGCNEGVSEAELKLPSWYNAERFKECQKYYTKYRFYISTGFLFGFIASLSIPSILQILKCTRQSDTTKKAYRRYVGTILHTKSWYTDPLEPGSKLWESLSYVRQAHFASSRLCSRKGNGIITQKDMVLTQLSLIGFFILGADRMNFNDLKFFEATTYMWRVLGYLFGIEDKYNICGDSWKETKPRFELVMKQVFRKSLMNAESSFYEYTRILLEGLRPVHTVLTLDSTVFYIKRLAGCKGYEFLESDFPNKTRNPADKLHYYSLGLWDRIVVSTAILTFTYFYKYAIIRWYMNIFIVINEWFLEHFPIVAIIQYGCDWAYVRIFSKIKTK